MKRNKDISTRDRILEAAGELFAAWGFRGATVRAICERCWVNISAIKYHFDGKEELYSEVLKYWLEFAIKKYPPLLGVAEDSPSGRMYPVMKRSNGSLITLFVFH